jgi:hypothetical protein
MRELLVPRLSNLLTLWAAEFKSFVRLDWIPRIGLHKP